jgi:hypothetical protein
MSFSICTLYSEVGLAAAHPAGRGALPQAVRPPCRIRSVPSVPDRTRDGAGRVGPNPSRCGTCRRSVTPVAQRTVSALRGRPPADQGDECLVSRGVDRLMDHVRRGREGVAWRALDPPVRGPDGPPFEAATTVRAHVGQDRIDALSAERALVRADHRVGRVGPERAVAVLARGSELEHVRIVPRSGPAQIDEAGVRGIAPTVCAVAGACPSRESGC